MNVIDVDNSGTTLPALMAEHQQISYAMKFCFIYNLDPYTSNGYILMPFLIEQF